MRIRQVKPEFWRDSTVAEMSDTVRLVYIGLWMEADDAGYLRIDLTEIATDLYPLTPRTTRERRVMDAMRALVIAKRVDLLPCDRHGYIKTLTEHQRLASPEKRVHTIAREHERECQEGIPAGTRGSSTGPRNPPEGTVRVNGKGDGKERGGVGGSADGANGDRSTTTDEVTPFQKLVPPPPSMTRKPA